MNWFLVRECLALLTIFSIVDSSWYSRKDWGTTSEFFKKIGEWELVTVSHRQLHFIDDHDAPIYPPNAVVEFYAHGTDFKLLLRQHHELFADNFQVTNNNHSGILEVVDWDHRKNKCFYHGDVEVNGTLSSARPFLGGVHLSTCKGFGLRGSFFIDGETFIIEPAKVHIDPVEFDAFTHRIEHEHIVYKESSLHSSVRPPRDFCAHGHPTNPVKVHIHDEHDHKHEHTSVAARKLLQTTIRYVELLVVNDPARCTAFGNDATALITNTIGIVNGVTSRYRAGSFDPAIVGTVQVVLINIQNWCVGGFPSGFQPQIVNKAPLGSQAPATAAPCSACYDQAVFNSQGSNAYEVEYNSFLTSWQNWRTNGVGVPEHDNGHLFSGYDFYSSVIGYASIPGMCITSQSGGINQMTYSDNYNAAVVAHEMGHNFNMQHDSTGNTCSERGDIMAAVGDTSTAPGSFSSCSVNYLNSFFGSFTTVCLNNQPTGATYATCRNGFKEQGEFCDCGSSDCTTVDACCDGNLCQLFADAECSSLDGCCDSSCKIKANGTLCRPKDPANECDIADEVCGGKAECPPDTFHVEGTVCLPQSQTQEYQKGMCFQQQCVSWNEQCAASGATVEPLQAPWTSCQSQYSFYTGDLGPSNTDKCGSLQCEGRGGSTCSPLQAGVLRFVSGTPCGVLSNNVVEEKQCFAQQCQDSSAILSKRWIAFGWDQCSLPCTSPGTTEVGRQTRTVFCGYQNGTDTGNPALCAGQEEPISNQTCNDFLCEFCRATSQQIQKCQPNGICDATNQRCVCNPGFSGENCDTVPQLNFTGITSRSFSSWTDCAENSSLTVSATNFTNCSVSCLSQLSGSSVLRAAFHLGSSMLNVSIGNATHPQFQIIQQERCTCTVYFPRVLQTTTIRVDPSGNLTISAPTCEFVTTKQPGVTSLAAVPGYTFHRGDYLTLRWTTQGSIDQVAVSFEDLNPVPYWNWNHYVAPELATNVDCNGSDPRIENPSCDDFRFQIPDDIPSGTFRLLVKFNNLLSNFDYSHRMTILCSDNRCNAAGHGRCNNATQQCECDPGWTGIICDQSNCADWSFRPLGADALSASQVLPQCLQSTATCDVNGTIGAAAPGGRCDCGTPRHWTGPYCELPVDGCTAQAEAACNTDPLCSYNTTISTCVYTACHRLSMAECNSSDPAVIQATQSQNCKWDQTLGRCLRQTCAEEAADVPSVAQATLPKCQQGAIRRPVSDALSICQAGGWFCDCQLAPNASSSNIVSASISDFGTTTPSPNLLTCQQCNLNCTTGSSADAGCTRCTPCGTNLRGLSCNHLFWIGSFDVGIPHAMATGFNKPEFDALLIQDLVFVFQFSDPSRISIDQVKPSGSGSKVFFRIEWQTTNEIEAQSIAGFRMKRFGDLVAQDQSVLYRGCVSNATSPSVAFVFCLPYKEECDPTKQANVIQILLICAGSSFGAMIIVIIIYRIATQRRRQRRYEQKVRDVKNAQLKLMDMHHHRAKRVGMKDVTKSRARKISRARHQRQHEEDKERAKKEKEIRRLSKINDDEEHDFQHGHKRSNSGVELAEIRENVVPGGGGEGGGFAAQQQPGGFGGEGVAQAAPVAFGQPHVAFDPNNVPPPWKVYFNDGNIPYYHNPTTGVTSWVHPYDH